MKKYKKGGKARLADVLIAAGDFITINKTVEVLSSNRSDAARILARWASQGLIKRIKRGIYAPVSLAAFGAEQVIEDPWRLVPEIFQPGYIGGWSAAEHWGLTEQLFRGICVLTAKPLRKKDFNLQGITFVVKQIDEKKMFGLKPVWKGQAKVMVSSPSRTIVDMLDDPSLGGGIRHVNDCLNKFLKEWSTEQKELIEFAKRINNGAVFKRLSFLLSSIAGYEDLVKVCAGNLKEGNASFCTFERVVHPW